MLHIEKIKKYKYKFKGKECFVIASGPSTNLQKLSVLKDKITIGVNQSYLVTQKNGFDPTFMCLSDPRLYGRIKELYCKLDSKIVFSHHSNKKYKEYDCLNLLHVVSMHPHGNVVSTRNGYFSSNIENIIPDTDNVVNGLALPFAIYMGLNPIYLLGCDCNNSGYSYNKKDDIGSGQVILSGVISGYETAKKYCEKKGIKIFNAGEGGSLHTFERKNFMKLDSLFPMSKKGICF